MKRKEVASEKERFKRLLRKKKRLGTIIINKRWLDDPPVSLFRLSRLLFGHELHSFFTFSVHLKVKDAFWVTKEIGLRKKDLLRYAEKGLLTGEEELKGNAPVSWYVLFYLLPLVMECDKVMKYSLSRIKEITDYLFYAILALHETGLGELDGRPVLVCPDLSGPPLVFLRKYFEWLCDCTELLIGKHGVTDGLPLDRREANPDQGELDLIDYLADFDYETAPAKDKISWGLVVFMIWLGHELWKKSFITLVHETILKGYSPQVWFKARKIKDTFTVEPAGDIDWGTTLKLTEKARRLSFFRTPDYELKLSKGRITILVFEPENVNSSVMRNIEKVYNIFRHRLPVSWGHPDKKKQRREEMEERDGFIQDLFLSMIRKEGLRVKDACLTVSQELSKTGILLGEKSIERIIYRLKKKS